MRIISGSHLPDIVRGAVAPLWGPKTEAFDALCSDGSWMTAKESMSQEMSKSLKTLLQNVEVLETHGDLEIPITGLSQVNSTPLTRSVTSSAGCRPRGKELTCFSTFQPRPIR